MWSPIQSKKQGSKKNSGVEVGDVVGEWKKNEKRWGRGRGNTFLNASSSFVKGRFNFFHMRLENITCFIASKNILEKQVRLRT